ncbi:MAG: GIN domain-containing protein, partial [Myxococcales bacterium]
MRVSASIMSLVLLASAGCFAAQKKDPHEDRGPAQTREVPAFHSVSVESGIHATISIGPQRPLELQGDEKVLALVETTVEDGELRIGFKRHKWHWTTSD